MVLGSKGMQQNHTLQIWCRLFPIFGESRVEKPSEMQTFWTPRFTEWDRSFLRTHLETTVDFQTSPPRCFWNLVNNAWINWWVNPWFLPTVITTVKQQDTNLTSAASAASDELDWGCGNPDDHGTRSLLWWIRPEPLAKQTCGRICVFFF